MLRGKCPKCGAYYYGWSLRNSEHQTCYLCGVELDIAEDDRRDCNDQNVPTSRDEVNDPPEKEKHRHT